jgi:glycosyltransferase involved in cell wall biosynthesis
MMDSIPRITVLMPVYNGEKYLREAIDSMLLQTFRDFEFLIIDDGSTDRSVEIIKSYTDPRIWLHNENNLGIIATLNKGINLAHGEYIARMDSDDISLPLRLEKQVVFMDENIDVGVCGTWIKKFMGGDSIVKSPVTFEEIKCMLLFGSCLAHPTVMLRTETLRRFNLNYNINHKHAEDYGLWIRCSKYFKLMNIPEVLLMYRWHSNQISQASDRQQQDCAYNISVEHISSYFDIKHDNPEVLKICILGGLRIRNFDVLIESHAWLNKLKTENSVIKIFDEQELNRILAERWVHICNYSTQFGYATWIYYWKSDLYHYHNMSLRRRIIFLVKCLIRKDIVSI